MERKLVDHSKWKRHGPIGACEKHDATVREMAESGATLDSIGFAIGTTKRYVRAYLTTHNIQRPDWRNPRPGSHPMARRVEGELNSQWNGGRTLDKHGYVLIWMPTHPEASIHGYVREHRIVMAQKLGRPLTREEVVHHKNGNTQDNTPDNLELFPSNGEHLRQTMTGVPCPARSRRYKSSRTETETCDSQPQELNSHPPS
jgi:hypothetical protein